MLKGRPVKIKGNKPKGKNTIKNKNKNKIRTKKCTKEKEVATPRFELTTRLSPAGQLPDHWTTVPLNL